MRNAGLEEAQAGIKIAGRNIDNLRYADDTTTMCCCCCDMVEKAISTQYKKNNYIYLIMFIFL